jgi:Na+-driven multidrug efflux pump
LRPVARLGFVDALLAVTFVAAMASTKQIPCFAVTLASTAWFSHRVGAREPLDRGKSREENE